MEKFKIGYNKEYIRAKNFDELKTKIDGIASKYPESDGYYRTDAIIICSKCTDLPIEENSSTYPHDRTEVILRDDPVQES